MTAVPITIEIRPIEDDEAVELWSCTLIWHRTKFSSTTAKLI